MTKIEHMTVEELKAKAEDLESDINHLEWQIDDIQNDLNRVLERIAEFEAPVDPEEAQRLAEFAREEKLLAARYGTPRPAVIRDWWQS